jgi:hypothetical protein
MINLIWKKKEKYMHVYGDKVEPWDVRVSCLVRNELNGWRKPNEVVYRITRDNIESHDPVQPRQFPNGIWTIEWIEPRVNRYQRPYYIQTNAYQMLSIWELDENGRYKKETNILKPDYSYGLHFSESNTTLGCIKIHIMEEFSVLLDQLWQELKQGIKPILEVKR